jgi:prevent-host-death family protein
VPPANTISIGQLRQNPTQMIRDVVAGAIYTVTDRGRPVADVVPHRSPQWVSGASVDVFLRQLGPEPAWQGELARLRDDVVVADPWEPRR